MMYRLFFISVFLFLASCSDGDFEVPSFDFEPNLNVCGTYVLYRANQGKTEALILLLKPNDIAEEAGEVSIPVSGDNIVYRIFDASFGSDYFCAPIPPENPHVKEQWLPKSGTDNRISIITTAVTDSETGTVTAYKHDITFYNLVLTKESDKIIYETFSFGSFNTSIR